MRKVALSRGYAISYEEAGQGGAVLLIPGFMQAAADFRHTGYVDRLADRWRVLAVDPLGHGWSDKPHDPGAYGLAGVTADVIAVLDACRIDRAVLWGYSRGTVLAAMAAIEYPDRLSGLILGGGAMPNLPPTQLPDWVEPLSHGDWASFWSLFGVALSPETRAHFEKVNDPQALAAERTGRYASGYRFDFSRVLVPSLVYCGSEDEPEAAAPMADALHTKVRVIEGRDHAGEFEDVESVMKFALPFLESIASRQVVR